MSEEVRAGDLFKIPYDSVNEQILLAAALTDANARALLLKRVRPDMFELNEHSAIWSALLDAEHKHLTPSVATLAQLSNGGFDKSYADDLVALYPTAPGNVEHHLETLLWDVTRLKSIRGPITSLLDALREPSSSPQRVLALANQVSQSLVGGGSRKFLRDGAKIAHEHAKTIAARMKGLALYPFGIAGLDTYGPADFDEQGNPLDGKPLLVPGAAPGQTTVMTAISGGGKSTITALIALEMARQGRRVLYGAWEMGAENTLELLACITTGIQRSRVQAGRITQAEAALLSSHMATIAQYIVFVDMPFGKAPGVRHKSSEVLDEIHAYIADSGCDVAIFDLWRRAFTGMRDESEEAEALYRQQAIAEETKVHCILVQQQRLKDVETRSNPRPTRDGIKGSSAWVDIADTILGIYIPALMKGTKCTTLETLVLKQRYGRWPIAVEHSWDGDLVKLSGGRVVAYEAGSEQSLGTKDSAAWFNGPGKGTGKKGANNAAKT